MSAAQVDYDVVILYASETGTAEDLAFKIGHEASCSKNLKCTVMSIADFPPERLLEPINVMFIIATSGDGEIVPDMRDFWKFFLRKRMGPSSLSNLTMSIFGLGDSSYEKYNASAR
jgi:sulfite reductase alpha subunit-like flavoprotein